MKAINDAPEARLLPRGNRRIQEQFEVPHHLSTSSSVIDHAPLGHVVLGSVNAPPAPTRREDSGPAPGQDGGPMPASNPSARRAARVGAVLLRRQRGRHTEAPRCSRGYQDARGLRCRPMRFSNRAVRKAAVVDGILLGTHHRDRGGIP